MGRRSRAGGCALLLGLTALLHAVALRRCGDGLSPTADAYSEANVLRSGERFAREGLGPTVGLPDVAYGGRFPGVGIEGPSGHRPGDTVYHGDPPGTSWLAALYIRALGIENLPLFRLAPVGLHLAASSVFLLALVRTAGATPGMIVYAACLLAPMSIRTTHSLYYYGYALSLWLLEIAALLRLFARDTPGRTGDFVLLGGLGFLQGWLSYEQCGVVAFSAVPLALLATPSDRPIPWRRLLLAVLVPGCGFVLAHVGHFLQSVAYFGDLRETLAEYAHRSGKLYGYESTPQAEWSRPALVLYGLRTAAVAYVRWTENFAPLSDAVLAATLAALTLARASTRALGRWRLDAEFAVPRRRALALLAALGVAQVWLVLKPFHALNHAPLIGRHAFLFYLCSCLVVAQGTRLRLRDVGGPRPEAVEAGRLREAASVP